MTIAQTDQPTYQKPLRLWPGVAAAVLVCLAWFVVPFVLPNQAVFGLLGAVVGGLAVIVWWLFLSRAPWSERVGALVVMIAAVFVAQRAAHPSIAPVFPFLAIMVMSLALVIGVVSTRRLSRGLRRSTMVAAILLACAAFTLVRTGGVTGAFSFDFHWRWTPTPEERLLAQTRNEPAPLSSTPVAAEPPKEAPKEPPAATAGDKRAALPATPSTAPSATKTNLAAPAAVETAAEWPGFRGPHRDGIIPGLRIATDWSASPPTLMWRRPVGPGWSSFAVHGNLFYTQEQRGDDEVVACYNLTTGKPVWMHRDAARFWEPAGGAGPRGTPTLSNGRVYALGATGILNALDAGTGAVVWSRNAAADTGAKLPDWGFAGSPLVVGDVVIVATSGKLVAYDLATGDQRWLGPASGGGSYSSPHLLTLDGVPQVLLMGGTGAISVSPADGALLWKQALATGMRIVQPAQASDGDVLMSAGEGGTGGAGMRLVAVTHGAGGWTAAERWTSTGLKANFNDFVVHKGHAYGFDGSILACIDLKDGQRKWKGGRYGTGQLVLLPDQDLLLVLSEEGELALVSATPGEFKELARVPAIEGKTWNHPALVGGVLLVRNGEEMAAFRLSSAP